MAQTIKIKRSNTSTAPDSLSPGELAYTHVPLTAQQIIDGVPDTAGKFYIGRPEDGTVDLIGGKYYLDRSEEAYGWGNHANAGYVTTTYADAIYAPLADSATQVYKSPESTASSWTSFNFAGYNNVVGKDYYVFDVYAYEDFRVAGQMAHYTVYINVRNSAGDPTTANEVEVEVIANNAINTDLDFYIERDLADGTHKLWIKLGSSYSQLSVVKAPLYAGAFSKVLTNMFATVTTDPVDGVAKHPVRKSLLVDSTGTTSFDTALKVKGLIEAEGKVVAGDETTEGYYVGTSQIVDGSKNVKNITNLTMTGTLKGPAAFTIDPAGHGDNTGAVTIAGDLVVTGTTTTINSTAIELGDRLIRLNDQLDEETAPTNLVAGLEIARGNTDYDSYILWREANDAGKKWVVSEGGPVDYPLLHANNWGTAYTGAVDGGTF